MSNMVIQDPPSMHKIRFAKTGEHFEINVVVAKKAGLSGDTIAPSWQSCR